MVRKLPNTLYYHFQSKAVLSHDQIAIDSPTNTLLEEKRKNTDFAYIVQIAIKCYRYIILNLYITDAEMLQADQEIWNAIEKTPANPPFYQA